MTKERRKKAPVCLSIAGLDPSGGAGILADIKTFAALGCYGAATVTSVTFQNTQGVFGAEHQSAMSVRRQTEPILEDFEVAAIKTGMLPSLEVIEATAALITESGVGITVVDPVVRSTSGFDLIDEKALRSLIVNLFPLADIVTPNLVEAERISGFRIRNEADFDRAARQMIEYGATCVLIKGGHSDADAGMAVDRLFCREGMTRFETPFIETTSTHGTGCTLASAIAANLSLGFRMEEAVGRSKDYVTDAIRTAEGIGKGNSPLNHWAGLNISGDK